MINLESGSGGMSMDKEKLLNLMRFWLFGTFVIVFAAITVYIGIFTGSDWLAALKAGFPIWGITAVVCVAWYFLYQFILNRRSE